MAMVEKVIVDLETGEERLVVMAMSRTLLQTPYRQLCNIEDQGDREDLEGNHITQRSLERIPILQFDGINEDIKLRAWIGKLS